MHRRPDIPTVVWFDPDEVREILLEAIRKAGVTANPIGFQIIVTKPFGADMTVHGEVPTLAIILDKGFEPSHDHPAN